VKESLIKALREDIMFREAYLLNERKRLQWIEQGCPVDLEREKLIEEMLSNPKYRESVENLDKELRGHHEDEK